MKKRYLVLIFIAATSIAASIFIYTLKNADKNSTDIKSGFVADRFDASTQTKSPLALKGTTIKEEINAAIIHVEESSSLKEDNNETAKEQTFEDSFKNDEHIFIEEKGVEDTIFHKSVVPPEIIKKKKRDKDIQETISVDDVDAQMEEIMTDRERWLANENIPDWIKEGIRELDFLKNEYNLDIGLSYRGTLQYEGVSNTLGSGDNIDIFGRYRPNEHTTFGFNVRTRHNYTEYSSKEFGDEIGSLYAVSPSYDDLSPFITEFWYQYLFDDLRVRFGFLNRNSFIDNSFYKNQNRYFLSSTFSLAPYNPLPENGPGIVLKYKKPTYYALAYIADSDVKKGESLGNILERDLKLYNAFEFGFTPEHSLYYVTLWDRDSKDAQNKGRGAIFSLNKMFENEYKVFAKYAFSSNAAEKEHFSFGLGRQDFYQAGDLLSMALGVAKSDDYRTQSSAEIFYRYNIYYGIQFTTSMQFVHRLSKSDEDWAFIPGVRVRIVF